MAADKKTLLRDALKQVQGGKIDKAVETYKAIIKLDPRDAAVHNTLGDLYVKLGKKKDAIAEYQEVAGLYEKDGFALRAIAMHQKVINLDPDMIAVNIKLGDLYSSQKLPAEGRVQYMKAASYYDKKGDVANALDIFRRIANLDPDNLSVRVKLAGMFEKQKFNEKAAEEYVRAAQGYVNKKEMQTAVQLYVRAFKLSPANSEARRRLADFYAQRQDWPVVVGLLETPVTKGSRDTDLLVLYAEALTRVNHPKEAVKVLEGTQKREPNLLPVNLTIGRAYLKSGEIEKGIEAINRCVTVHLAENRLEPAESLLREMAEAAPDDDKILQRMLEVAQQRGDKPAVAKAYLQLAGVYEKKNLVRAATGVIEKYLEINPGDAAGLERLQHLQALTPAPKVEAPPPPPPPPPVSKAPPPPPVEDVSEISLEEDVLETIAAGEDEEELVIEVEGEAEAVGAPVFEPRSVAEALAAIKQGAPQKSSEFLMEHLGGNPDDIEAWEALIEARRRLGDDHGVRDGFLRMAGVHRRAARFDEARSAYKGALDADPRSTAAARGLADVLIEEEAAAKTAPVPQAPQADSEEEISIDLFDQTIGEAAVKPEPDAALQWEPEPEPVFEVAVEPEPETALQLEPEAEPVFEAEIEPEPEPLLEMEAAPGPEAALPLEPEPVAAPPESEPAVEQTFVDAPVAADEGSIDEAAPQFWDFQGFVEPQAESASPEAAPEEQPPAQPMLEEFSFDEFVDESTGFDARGAEPPPLPTEVPVPPIAAAAEETAAPQAAGAGEFEEFLAEADFYFQQGLVDEAEFLYSKLLRLAPGHPGVTAQLRKLQEIRTPSQVVHETAEIDNLEDALNLAFSTEEPEPIAEAPPTQIPAPPPSPQVQAQAPTPPQQAPPPAPSADLDKEFSGFSDFLAGMNKELEIEPLPSSLGSPPPQTGEESLTEIFQEFQRSVKEQLGDEDYETHYNLGIAYKEMGLLDEAVTELLLAEKSPLRRLTAVSMIALILREMGRFDEAALKLRTGISLAVEGSEDQKGFLYDLAALHEQAGRATDAQEALRRLLAIDPGYRDVAARVGAAPPAPSATPRKKSKVSYL